MNPGTETDYEPDETTEHCIMYIRFRTGNAECVEETLPALDRSEEPTPSLECVYRDIDVCIV